MSDRDGGPSLHQALGAHLSPRAVHQAAARPSEPAPGAQVRRPVSRRETPPTGTRKSNRLSFTVALAALDALGHIGDEPAVHRLLSMLQNADQDLQVAAASALADSRSALAEPALIAALDSIWPAVQRAAAIALGSVGSVASMPRLRELGSHATAESKLRALAQQALAAIQSRLPDATPGQLSLSTGDAGRISLADDASSGRVSLPEGD